jgi:hypothetical protein
MDTKSLSHAARTIILARIAYELTVCARSTYAFQSETVREPKVLRGYNELQHRVTASLLSHVTGEPGLSLEDVVKLLQEFGIRVDRTDEVGRALESALERPLPTEH